eukprot:gnl/TRDRNA2_/TRDRNA2_65340_c0_seq1.p1 gnl/TRDRNA2_/TRDRNA2_65340_c0~~gnl/TRDRNA2_/TRDRNA2_65340_c0_seq1.p1  ORF type:complete len:131 (+),score=57.30 gnl/TRDRNA2_/TRDRNA2_65340_c0_seq1:92-484(+)
MPTDNAATQKAKLEKELEVFKGLQETLQKNYESRMSLIAQQQESQMVQEEFNSIEEDAKVYKLVGPVLVKQSIDDAKNNVEKRLEYISGELERSNKVIEGMEADIETKKQELIKMQQEAQEAAAAAGSNA